MKKRFFALLILSLFIIQLCPAYAQADEPEKLFELDMSGFSMSLSSGSSGLKSSISNPPVEIEAYGGTYLSLAKSKFRNASGESTAYLSKTIASSAYNWAQVGGRLALSGTALDDIDVSYEFWANVTDSEYKRWKNVSAIEMLWENADGTAGEKQITLSSDTASDRWIASGGEYFSVGSGWHNVVITKSSKTSDSSGTSRSFTFYVDGVKRAEPIELDIPSGASVTGMRLLFGQSRTTKINAQTDHFIPMDGSFGGISIYSGILSQTEINSIYTAEKSLYTQGDAKLLFDMNLSEYDPDSTAPDKGIKNSVSESGTASGIELSGGVRSGTDVTTAWFEKGSYTNSLKEEIPYVSLKQTQFSNSVDAATARLFIDNPDWTGKSYTAEAWINPVRTAAAEAYYYSPIFSAYGGQTDTRTNSLTDLMRLCTFNSYNTWYLGSDTGRKVIDGTDEGWLHVVITRSTDGSKAVHEAYINGVKHFSAGTSTTTNAASDGRAGIVFGSLSSKNWYVCPTINIAGVKIYDDVLSPAEISAHYSAELEKYTPSEVGLSFTDSSGKTAESLNDMTSVTLKYVTAKSDNVQLIGACYDDNGVLINAESKLVSSSDTLSFDIPYGTFSVKGFAWDRTTNSPSGEAVVLSYTDGYDPSAVTANADFYDSSGSTIKFMSGKSGIYVKAKLSSFMPPNDIKAELKLVRNGEAVFAKTEDAVFSNKISEVTIPLDGTVPQEGDQLIFTLYRGKKTYMTKKLSYEDLSATLDIILVAGQSNALGQGGDASQSIKPDTGTVYYNNMNTCLTGNIGWDSALGKTWHDETGHTVLIVKATWGGTGFPTLPDLETGVPSQWGSSAYGYWNPNNSGSKTAAPYDCYTLAKEKYAAATASIDTDKYKIGDCVYFWNQGENENNSYTADMYETAFLELHNKFITEFGTEETRLTCGGILPVRSSYSKGFPNLYLTGPRIAQYKMARERSDIFIVSDATEHWYSDASIKEWFAKKYDGTAYPSGSLPSSWTDIMNTDNVHYKQAAMNEFGKEAAEYMLANLKDSSAPSGIDLITPDGIRHYADGESITLTKDGAIPVIPAYAGTKASYSISGDAAVIDENGVLKPQKALLNDYAVLTVTPVYGSKMTFRVYSPLIDGRINISSIKDNKSAIYSLTTDDNYSYTNKWIDGKLSEYGMKATMGLVPNWMDTSGKLSWSDAQSLVSTGRWGVANHTKAHKQTVFGSLTEAELEEEIDGGRDILLRYFPDRKILSMYTPGGITSSLIRSKVNENHHILRHAGGGNNNLPITEDGMLALKSQALFTATALSDMNGWIDSGIEKGQWIVEMWHGVGDTDAASWGGNVSEETATEHIAYVSGKAEEGKLWVTTLDEAAAYMIQRLKSRLHIVSETDSQLIFTLTDELDDTIYDMELTVNIPIPDGYTSAQASINGNTIASAVSGSTVSVTVKPDSGNITVNFQ